jgi:hypothetical protein
MNFLATGPSRPPASTTNPCTAPLYFFLFTASPAFADTPGWTCVFCLATTDLVAGHTMATSAPPLSGPPSLPAVPLSALAVLRQPSPPVGCAVGWSAFVRLRRAAQLFAAASAGTKSPAVACSGSSAMRLYSEYLGLEVDDDDPTDSETPFPLAHRCACSS